MNRQTDVMEKRSTNIMDYLHAHPAANEVAVALAKKSKDESKPSIERSTAMWQLNELIMSLDVLINEEEDPQSIGYTEKNGQPEYKFVNGARVRVKK